MNPLVELNLSLILFLPWFLILSVLFWVYPRQPRGLSRRLFDLAAIALSLVAFALSQYWSFDNADPGHGRMWKHILATALGYGVFLAVMLAAFVLRRALLRPRA